MTYIKIGIKIGQWKHTLKILMKNKEMRIKDENRDNMKIKIRNEDKHKYK